MPVWHAATDEFRDDGRIAMVGIVQEQHPARARLFMQWKGMDWPLLVDALNELEVAAVPITVFIDEHGIVRRLGLRRMDVRAAVEAFLAETYEAPAGEAVAEPAIDRASELDALRAAARDGDAAAQRRFARTAFAWGDPDEAVRAFEAAVALAPDDPLVRFQLGVALRRRAEGPRRRDGDFQAAVDAWSSALARDPNQYIWRRRIQQYGPRGDKPYPFYDWVPVAREELRAAGIEPVPLAVEPSGAEFAAPTQGLEANRSIRAMPDPHRRIAADDPRRIRVTATVVPAAAPGRGVRVHLTFEPDAARGHWNNEAEPLVVWVRPPDGWAIDRNRHVVARDTAPVSDEPRTVEFELGVPAEAVPGDHALRGVALYNVCDEAGGACLHRRLDWEVPLRVTAPD